MKNEMNEIPTPETNAFMLEYNRAIAAQKTRPSMWDKLQSLERRLALLTEHVGLCHDEMGESRDSDASELHLFFRREVANDKRRIIDAVNIIDLERRLTIARETLIMIADESSNLAHAERMADRALKQTAPKP